MRKKTRTYLRSGLYVSQPELPARNTAVGAILAERRNALIADLGGKDACSTAQLALVDLAVRQWAQVDSVDAYLLTLPSLVDKRHRRVWQVVLDRARLAGQLEATLARLGLERRAKPVESLATYIARKRSTDRDEDPPGTHGQRATGDHNSAE